MMWILLIFLALRLLSSESLLLNPEIFLGNPLHRACMGWTQLQGLSSVYGGLFCGSTNIDGPTKNLFLSTGLYHLLVVSGAHLVFLENGLDRVLKGHERTKLSVFFVFALVCQLNPPILRALFSQGMRLASSRNHLFLSDETRILSSGLLCLILFPQWVHSTSLILSWTASLALNYKSSPWAKHGIVAIYLLPWTQTLSAASILNNFLFSFAFELFLFPASFLLFMTPGSRPLANGLWELMAQILERLPQVTSTLHPPPAVNYWPYVFIFHLLHRVKT